MTAQITSGVARVVAEMVKGKKELDVALANQVAGAIAKNFKVKLDEVAILRLTPSGRELEFVVPEKLAKVGTIPLTSTNALAVRTVRDRKPELVNKFTTSEHPTVFEAVPLREEGRVPIQKILSVPILVKGKAAGVIQVSRKGATPAAAGADFTHKDSGELSQVASALASCFPSS